MTRSREGRRRRPAVIMSRRRAVFLSCLASALLLLPAAGPGQDRQRDKVVVGEVPILPSIGTFIALERGYFEELGLEVEMTTHKASPQVIPLLATGKIDVGGGGVNAALFNALAGGADILIVADKGHHPREKSVPPSHGIVFSARRRPVALNREALQGKTFAVPGRGSPQEIYLELFLRRYGLGLDDVELVAMPLTGMLPGLAEGSIFGAALLEPFLTIALERGMAAAADGERELYPGQQAGVVMFSRDFAQRRRETAVKYLAGYLRGVRTFEDLLGRKGGRGEVFAVARKYTALDDADLFARMAMPSLDPDGRLNVESMEADLRWLHERGFVENAPELSRFVDASIAVEALAILGSPAR